MSPNRPDSENSSILVRNKSKDRGDLPVVIVASAAAVIVITMILLFLIILPNHKIEPVLKARLGILEKVYAYHKNISDNAVRFRDELDKVRKESKEIEAAMVKNPDAMEEPLVKTFKSHGFNVDSYRLGNAYGGDDQWWRAVPIEFTVSGPRDRVLSTVGDWRKSIPTTVRLKEADIKKGENVKTAIAVFSMKANFIMSQDKLRFDSSDLFQPMVMPEASLFESRKIKDLKREIAEKEREILELTKQTGEISHLRDFRARLIALQSRRADYAAQREREFDLLERQLGQILPRLEEKEVHRIIIKVEDTYVRERTGK